MKRKLNPEPTNILGKSAHIDAEQYSKIKFQSLFSIVEKSLDDDRIWVSDFRNDSVFVTNDLYDVITAYHHFYREIRESA